MGTGPAARNDSYTIAEYLYFVAVDLPVPT